jgi:hypothetical protein
MHKHLSIAACSSVLLLVGCGTPHHTNTLIFGTNTKFAIDVSADPTGNPGVTVGYKRHEAVWMPLVANKTKDGAPADDCQTNQPCVLQGASGSSDKDAYSVLATFGATFSGEASGVSNPKAGGGIAQYFATGLAARELARKGGAQLVSIQPEGSVEQAAGALIKSEALNTEKILAYVDKDGKVDGTRLATLAKGTGADAGWIKSFTDQPVSKLREELSGPSRPLIAAFAANIKTQ